jgi:pimeloyl-ACP methyl ester carboxylesterase
MSTMTSVRANGVELGVETFGRDDDPLVLLAGGPTMLSWPDSVCERLAAGGRRMVRYDLRDCGASTTLDPEAPGYRLRDLAADAVGAQNLRHQAIFVNYAPGAIAPPDAEVV